MRRAVRPPIGPMIGVADMRLRLLALASVALAAAPAAHAQGEPAGCAAPIYAGQDFTVGEWDVFTGGKKTAEVTMEKSLDGCAIAERWTVPAGEKGNGLGLFVYSALLKGWSYLWASDTGSTTAFTGTLIRPGEIRYVTEKPLGGGKVRLRHWTLSAQPDGKVRELSVGTEDGGKTWTTEYDLMWVRRK
jgi:hypothetical protein